MWRIFFAWTWLVQGAFLHPAQVTAKEARSCNAGATLRLSSPLSSQGSLLLVELKSARPLTEVKGNWDGKSVPFWQEAGREAVHAGLLGVDLEKPPGRYELKVTAQKSSGEKIVCSARIPVKAGKFATERLSVGKEFVEPNPEQVKRANEERDRLREIFDRVTPERLWDGRFRVPLDGVATGSNFGKRRILNGNPGSPHGGADLPGTTGTPVHATQRGRVVLAEELFFAGKAVVLDHGLGVYTLYGHLSEIDVNVGDTVEKSEVVGKVGATGRVTGPHLHWGLTVERARVNPLELVKLFGREGSSRGAARGRGTSAEPFRE